METLLAENHVYIYILNMKTCHMQGLGLQLAIIYRMGILRIFPLLVTDPI